MDGIVVIILPGGIVRIAVHDTDFSREREREIIGEPAETVLFRTRISHTR